MNGRKRSTIWRAVIGLAVVICLGVLCLADELGQAKNSETTDDGRMYGPFESLPPLPGLEASELFGWREVWFWRDERGVLIPSGVAFVGRHGEQRVPFCGSLPVTLSGVPIDYPAVGMENDDHTIVWWIEYYPDGTWHITDLTGLNGFLGRLSLCFIGDVPGKHYVLAWVDGNRNGLVDPYETTYSWLEFVVEDPELAGSVPASGMVAHPPAGLSALHPVLEDRAR